jgi:hypothetical protein
MSINFKECNTDLPEYWLECKGELLCTSCDMIAKCYITKSSSYNIEKKTNKKNKSWIYILRCENNSYYIGQTSRLYRRFWEHQKGNGGVNTFINKPEEIVAIYPVYRLSNFFKYDECVSNNYPSGNIYFNRDLFTNFNEENENEEYDPLWVENLITEKMILDNNNLEIKGGKYIRSDIDYVLPISNKINNLPNCNC